MQVIATTKNAVSQIHSLKKNTSYSSSFIV